MWHHHALAIALFAALASLQLPSLLRAQLPDAEKKVIVIPIDTMGEAKKAGDLLTWIHIGSVKFGGTDPVYRLRVLKDGTAMVPKDARQRESRLKLTAEEIASLQKTLLEDIAVQHINGAWFNGKGNNWDGSQDCFLVREDQQVVTLTCEYGWPTSDANRDHTIRRYHQAMQTYIDLIYLVRAGGKEAIARQVPLANEGLKQHLPEATPLTVEDFRFGEDFTDGHRRLTYLREKEMADGQWEKVRVEVLVPNDGKPRLGDITINGQRF